MKVYALVDCNNFYVSCERVFNPALKNKPVVVLSNNDGCIIARSNEVKKLGVPMGAPLFEWHTLLIKHKATIFSSNFPLYADMSSRVMRVLFEHAPDVEIYSIDEAFLYLDYNHTTLAFIQNLQKIIYQWTGIPVSIGLGPTKTLAKLANKYAKKNPEYTGIYSCINHDDIDQWLSQFAVEDIWGVGRRYKKLLYDYRIKSAVHLKYANDAWIRKKMTVAGLRMVHELRGIPCIPFLEHPEPQKNIACTRSFAQPILMQEKLQYRIASFVAKALQKLRKQKLLASSVYVFITTSRFKKDEQYANAIAIPLANPTDYTPEVIAAALKGLSTIFRPGFAYKRAGIILLDLLPREHRQQSLFETIEDRFNKQKMMETLDRLNAKWGSGAIGYAAEGNKSQWRAVQERKSERFTTSWYELLRVKS